MCQASQLLLLLLCVFGGAMRMACACVEFACVGGNVCAGKVGILLWDAFTASQCLQVRYFCSLLLHRLAKFLLGLPPQTVNVNDTNVCRCSLP